VTNGAEMDQRTASTYIFGATCTEEGKGATLVLPHCNSHAMSLHLAEISNAIAPGAHAGLLVDQAGWHLSDKLLVPPNITIVPLPPKCPELNPVENFDALIVLRSSQPGRMHLTLLKKRFSLRGADHQN
jgi:hypothetical protein